MHDATDLRAADAAAPSPASPLDRFVVRLAARRPRIDPHERGPHVLAFLVLALLAIVAVVPALIGWAVLRGRPAAIGPRAIAVDAVALLLIVAGSVAFAAPLALLVPGLPIEFPIVIGLMGALVGGAIAIRRAPLAPGPLLEELAAFSGLDASLPGYEPPASEPASGRRPTLGARTRATSRPRWILGLLVARRMQVVRRRRTRRRRGTPR